MSVERLYLINPFNDKHIELIESFEEKNNVNSKISDYMKTIKKNYLEEDYLKKKRESNEIEEGFFLEKNSEIVDVCHLHGEKDIKICRITFTPLENKKRKLIILSTDYALNTLGMQEVFISVSSTDKTTIAYLKSQGYENLGEEDGSIVFLKDQEDKKNMQRKIG